MTDASVQETIEAEYETELSRLGSSKAIYALTGGEMETGAVLAALGDRAATAAATFEVWTDDPAHGDVFASAAETAESQAEEIADVADGLEPADAPQATDEALRDLDDSDARLGGLLAWTLVSDRTAAQAVGFFVGNADPQSAERFRGLRSDVDEIRRAALDALADADEETALEAASRVVEAAYADYVETLEGLGVKVKPVC